MPGAADTTAIAAPGAQPAAPVPRPLPESPSRVISVSNVVRLLVFAALAAFLLYYVGPRDIAETTVKVALAVALTAVVWVGANLVFDQAYSHWSRFNALVGA